MKNESNKEYENYLENWIPPLHPKAEKDLDPLPLNEFLEKHQHLSFNEDAVMEEHFGHLEPLDITNTIGLIAQLK